MKYIALQVAEISYFLCFIIIVFIYLFSNNIILSDN